MIQNKHATATAHAPRSRRRRGFTLTELLVVIGIVVLLAAIGLPMVLRSFRSGNKIRTQSDLNSIAMALNAYKQDHGDYPRVNAVDTGGTPIANLGAAVLGKALIGSYGDGVESGAVDPNDPPSSGALGPNIKAGQCVSGTPGFVALVDEPGPPPAADKWAVFDANDGADGPGFRTRRGPGPDNTLGTADDVFQGKVYGPYLQAEKFNVSGTMLMDRDDNPVLYFPAAHGAPNIRGPITTAAGSVPGFVARSEHSKYDANDNLAYFKRAGDSDADALKPLRVMLGDIDFDGIIDASEQPATEEKFLLWTAGPDGLFGPIRSDTGSWNPTRRDVERCDDVTNFSK
jgi:prepilin-type N-terminal cleavage/methylation domain-containing protein